MREETDSEAEAAASGSRTAALTFATIPVRPMPLEPAELHAYVTEVQRLCAARFDTAQQLASRKAFAKGSNGHRRFEEFIEECVDVLSFLCASLVYLYGDFSSHDIDPGDLPGFTIGTAVALCAGLVVRALEVFGYFDDLLRKSAADFRIGRGFVHANLCRGNCRHRCRVGQPGFPAYASGRGVSPAIEQVTGPVADYSMTDCLEAWDTLATAWYGILARDLAAAHEFRQALLVRSLALWAGVHRFPVRQKPATSSAMRTTTTTTTTSSSTHREQPHKPVAADPLPATAAGAAAVIAAKPPEETAAAAEYVYTMGPYDGSIGTEAALETTFSSVLLQRDGGGLVPRPRFALIFLSRAFGTCQVRRPFPRSVAERLDPFPVAQCLQFFWERFYRARTGTAASETIPAPPAPPEGVDEEAFQRSVVDAMVANIERTIIDVKAERSATNFLDTIDRWCKCVETNRALFRMKTQNLTRMTLHDFQDATTAPSYRQYRRLELATYSLARYISPAIVEALPPFDADIAFLYLLGAYSNLHKGPPDFLGLFCGKPGAGPPAAAAHFAPRPATTCAARREGVGSASAMAEANAALASGDAPPAETAAAAAAAALLRTTFVPPTGADGWPTEAEMRSGRWRPPVVVTDTEPRLFLLASDLVVVRVGTQIFECPSVGHAVICLFALLWAAAADSDLATALHGGERLYSIIEDLSFVGLCSQFALDAMTGTAFDTSAVKANDQNQLLLAIDPWSRFGEEEEESKNDEDVVMSDCE